MKILSYTICLAVALTMSATMANAELVAHWTFDEGSGTTAVDSAGGNNGTVYGATWTQGKVGGALSFDGSGYVLGSSSPFDFANTTFSVCAWFQTTNLDSVTIVSEGAYGNGGWHLGTQGNVYFGLKSSNYTDNAYSTITANSSYNNGQWHHVAAVVTTNTSHYAGNSALIYIDGMLVAAAEGPQNGILGYMPSATNWSIGARDAATRSFFNGLIDDVRIYDSALSQSEITALVPEPATMMLLGLGGLLLRKRRVGL